MCRKSDKEDDEMKVYIVCDSVTFNTKKLMNVIIDTCNSRNVEIVNDLTKADLVFAGSWTCMGMVSDNIKKFLKSVINKKVFVFGTCGFGDNEDYYLKLFKNVCNFIPASNQVVGYFYAPGKMPYTVREKYLALYNKNPDEKIKAQIENFDKVLKRPNEQDLANLKNKVLEVLDACKS